MSEPSGPRHTPSRKAKNMSATERRTALDSDEVSSTSLDKHDDITNGSAMPHNDISEYDDEQCEASGDRTVLPAENFVIPDCTMPAFNVPEKIIIVYDSAVDEVSTGFTINSSIICPTAMLKRSLRFFLFNKHLIDPRHEYALIVINDNGVTWLIDFTNHIDTIITTLEDIPTCETEDILVLDNLFEVINSKVKLPEVKENFNIPPPFVVRVLFTYGRSFTLPQVDEKLAKLLVTSPYFTFDILMTHEMPSANNNCIKIFKDLQLIDKKGFAYFFPVGRSASQLHLSMAKLLGHPLQRAVQRAADYSIFNVMET